MTVLHIEVLGRCAESGIGISRRATPGDKSRWITHADRERLDLEGVSRYLVALAVYLFGLDVLAALVVIDYFRHLDSPLLKDSPFSLIEVRRETDLPPELVKEVIETGIMPLHCRELDRSRLVINSDRFLFGRYQVRRNRKGTKRRTHR